MHGAAKQKKHEELIDKASESLRRSAWFEAERLASKALGMARSDQAFDRMAAVIPSLLESRRQRLRQALEVGKIVIVERPITEDMKIKPGCYMVAPPNVASDARRLRLAALSNDTPVAVISREPLTRTGLVPLVAISPGSTIRIRIDPPAKPNAPDMAWFIAALEELGDWAIETLDPTLPMTRRIDTLLEHLDALPEHEHLHLALETACRQAHETSVAEKSVAAAKSAAKSKIKS